jgi:hypothetical protein
MNWEGFWVTMALALVASWLEWKGYYIGRDR